MSDRIHELLNRNLQEGSGPRGQKPEYTGLDVIVARGEFSL